MEEQLIRAVQAYPCLYDKTTTDYKLIKNKKSAWQAVAYRIEESEKRAKRRWKSLRDRFVKEFTEKRSEDEYTGSWPYFEMMMFLKDHITKRSATSLASELHSEEEVSPLSGQAVQDSSKHTFPKLPHPPQRSVIENFNAVPNELTSGIGIQSAASATAGKKRRKIKKDINEKLCNFISQAEKLVEQKMGTTSKRKHASFLDIIEQYIEKVPEEKQDSLKLRILNFTHAECGNYNKTFN